jgi:hypothetical protein
MKMFMAFFLLICTIYSYSAENCNNVFVTLRGQEFTRSIGVNGDYMLRQVNLRKKAGAISSEATVSDSGYLLVTKWPVLVDELNNCNFESFITIEQFEKIIVNTNTVVSTTFRNRSLLLGDTQLTQRGCYSQGFNSTQNMFCNGLSSPASCIRAGRVSGCYWVP